MRRAPLLGVVALLLAACGAAGQPAQNGPLRVVASFSVVGDLVANVAGDHVALTTLVGPATDAHTFTPGPAEAAALARARLVFENGLGFEPWLDDLYTASGSRARRVAVAEGLEPLAAPEGDTDPHAWQDPRNAIAMVEAVRAALSQADPANASSYAANAAAYTADLEALDDWIEQAVAQIPPERRRLVTTHETLGYFARRYGFEVLGTLLPTTTEGASPSAQRVAALADGIRAAGVPAVFSDNVSTGGLLQQVAAEAGVQVAGPLYTDALGAPGSGAGTYIGMMRFNVTTVVTALKGG